MLVLSRRANEQITLPGLDVTFTILEVQGNRVKIGVCAPQNIEILRAEVERSPRKPVRPDESSTPTIQSTYERLFRNHATRNAICSGSQR